MSNEISCSLKTFVFRRQTVSPFARIEIHHLSKTMDLVELGRLLFKPLVSLSVQWFHLDELLLHNDLSMLYIPATLRSEANQEGANYAYAGIRLETITWYTVEPVLSGTLLSGHSPLVAVYTGLTVWISIVFHFCFLFIEFLKNLGMNVNYKIIYYSNIIKLRTKPL